MATVVRTWKSAPRPAGSSMLVTAAGEAVGSVSGGCVEGALYDVGTEVRDGAAARYERYGVSDEDAFAVGLTCGGILEVFVERVSRKTLPELPDLARSIEVHQPVAVATVGPRVGPARSPAGRPCGPRRGHRSGTPTSTAPSPTRRGAARAGITGVVRRRPGRPCGWARAGGLRREPRTATADDRLRRHRLRRRARPGGQVARAPRDRVRRPAGVRDPPRFPEADEVVVDWPHRWLEQRAERSTPAPSSAS